MDAKPGSEKNHLLKTGVVAAIVVAAIVGTLLIDSWLSPKTDRGGYPWHNNITATVFWIGEGADDSNDFIHNRASAWTRDWVAAYGGVDNPDKLCDFKPCDFTPGENSFYAALPYNDLDEMCQPKGNQDRIYWFQNTTGRGGTLIKNRWIEIKHDDKTTYAQLEDVGPFGEDDIDYVFGDKPPQESRSGLDLSPAAAKYLGLDGRGQVNWRFIEAEQVPAGPWAEVITKSGPDC